MTDLLRLPCDGCGKPVGGGRIQCKKCHLTLCFLCHWKEMVKQKIFPIICPICGEKFSFS